MNTKNGLNSKIKLACEQFYAFLIPLDKLTIEESQTIIKRWVAAFESNFQGWSAGAMIASQSDAGKLASLKNLQIELRENHASMLRQFAISANAEPELEDFHAVSASVEKIRMIVAEMSPIKNLALMAILESDREFYPYLAHLAQRAKSKSFQYTEIHTFEDIKHAAEFEDALSAEIALHEAVGIERQIDEVVTALTDLYRSIFRL